MRRQAKAGRADPRLPWQIEQGRACGCRGTDDMCPCQNVERGTHVAAPMPAVAAAPGTWKWQNRGHWLRLCVAAAKELEHRRLHRPEAPHIQDERLEAAAAIRLLLDALPE